MNIIRKFVVSPATTNSMKIVMDKLNHRNIIPIFDYAAEHTGNNNCNEVKNNIENIIQQYPNNFAALKISAFDMNRSNGDIVNDCLNIINMFKKYNTQITIDAEQVEFQDKISNITDDISKNGVEVYKTYQMYRKDSLDLLHNDLKLYKQLNLTFCAKLVRGAYYVQDKKTNMLCDTIEHTHYNYNEGIKMIIKEINNNKDVKLIAATHNLKSIELAKQLIKENNIDRIYFAHLLGFLDNKTIELSKDGYNVMKYVPFGPILKTYPYLFRRLIENYELTKFI